MLLIHCWLFLNKFVLFAYIVHHNHRSSYHLRTRVPFAGISQVSLWSLQSALIQPRTELQKWTSMWCNGIPVWLGQTGQCRSGCTGPCRTKLEWTRQAVCRPGHLSLRLAETLVFTSNMRLPNVVFLSPTYLLDGKIHLHVLKLWFSLNNALLDHNPTILQILCEFLLPHFFLNCSDSCRKNS